MARDFSGSTQAYNLTAPITTVPWTMACWANLDNVTDDHYLISVGDTGGNGNYYALIAAGTQSDFARVALVTSGGTNGVQNSTDAFTAGSWFHFTAKADAALDVSAYLNGGGKGTSTAATADCVGLDSMGVGRLERQTPTAYTNGSIAEAAIWDIDLSDAEIALLYSTRMSPLLMRPDRLVFYAPLMGDAPLINMVGPIMTAIGAPAKDDHPAIIYPSHGTNYFVPAGGAPPAATLPSGSLASMGVGI